MKDLGFKSKENMFIGPASEPHMPKVTYTKVDLPLSFIEDKDIKKDQELTITLKVKLVGFEDNEYRSAVTFEVKEGEIEGHDKKKTDEPSLLG